MKILVSSITSPQYGNLTDNKYVKDRFQIEQTAFLKKYNAIHGIDFVV